ASLLVDVIEVEMKGSSVTAVGHPHLQRINAIDDGVEGVFEPFARGGPTHIVTAARIAGGFDINGGGAILAAVIRGIGVVIGNAFAAAIEIFGLDCSGDCLWNTVK